MAADAGVVLVVVPDTGEREQLAALISERGARFSECSIRGISQRRRSLLRTVANSAPMVLA